MKYLNLKYLVLFGSTLFCMGCADTASLKRANNIQSEGYALFSDVNELIGYEAIPEAVPNGMTPESFEKQQWDALSNGCLAPRQHNIEYMYDQMLRAVNAGEKIRALQYAAQQADKIEGKFCECARGLGLKSETLLVLSDGQKINMAERLKKAIPMVIEREQALTMYADSVERQNQFWLGFGAALAATASAYAQTASYHHANPSQIWVDPYLRADGSTVTGHLRTTPNYTCIDNLGGC